MGGSGWAEIEPVFHRMGTSLSACRSYDIEVIAARACDELAYTIAHERGSAVRSLDREIRTGALARRVRSAVPELPEEREGRMTLSIELHSIRSLNESSEPSASDELYVLVTVASVRPPIVGLPIPAIPNFRVFPYGVFGDMDDDDPGPVIVRGPPFWGMDGTPEDIGNPDDVAIIVSVMENDSGTPAQYVELINAKTAISLGASAGAPQSGRSQRAPRCRHQQRAERH